MKLADMFPQDMKNAPQQLKDLYTPYNLQAAVPEVGISQGDDHPGTYGWVDKRIDPSLIFLNKRANMKNAPHVVAHEYEHVLHNNVDKRYKNMDTNWDMEFIKESKLPTNQIVGLLKKSAVNKNIRDYFQTEYNFPIKYFGDMFDGEFSLREQFAELSAAENYLKKDLTKDPFVRKHIFGDNEDFIQAYKASSGLRTNRLDAKDLPPMKRPTLEDVYRKPVKTEESGFLERIMNMMK